MNAIHHACGHQTIVAAPPAPHRRRAEEERPCRSCRRGERIAAQIRNRAAGLPELSRALGTYDQVLLAEEVRDLWRRNPRAHAEQPTPEEAVNPVWWIARRKEIERASQ